MRDLIAHEKGMDDRWNIKLARGGLIEIEFISQFLVLQHSKQFPELICRKADEILGRAASHDLIDRNKADRLCSAYVLYATIQQVIQLAVGGKFEPERFAHGVLRRLASAAHLPDFKTLDRVLFESQHDVRQIFEELLPGQAAIV